MIAERTTPTAGEWPAEDLEEVLRCPVCASPYRTTLYTDLRDRLFGCPGRWTLRRCDSCGSVYLDPRPTPDSIGRAYEHYYTHQITEREDVSRLGFLRRIRRSLANGYLNRRFGADYRPASRLGGLAFAFVPGMRHALDALGRHLPHPWPGARLLDIGCGNGDFLDLARRSGWRVTGVELDPAATKLARDRGLEVFQGTIDALPRGAGTFDVITLSHVIEHVHDPVGLLARCRELLRSGGWLWIDTPNLESFGYGRFGAHWRGLEPPRHLVLFTKRSLLRALHEAGFTHVRPMPWRPVAAWTFPVSAGIGARGTYKDGDPLSASARILGLVVDLRSWRDERRREFLTVTAQ